MNSPLFFTGLVMLVSAVVMVVSLLQLARLRDEDPARPRRRRPRSRLSLRRLRSRASESLRRHGEPAAWAMSRDLAE
jgi:hypothetical protein